MCGIAGCFGANDAATAAATVEGMLTALRHRGPDDAGIWTAPRGNAVLGHRRLAILDTTTAGHQPMGDHSGRLWLVYNGEIYNHAELRQELETKGYVFRSKSDTEVVLAAYHAWGVACLPRFIGMFAFALVDIQPPAGWPEFFLARDRLGIKPLLYAHDGPGLWFASELRALSQSGRVSQELDGAALADFLAVGAVMQPRTMLRAVQALPPGAYLTVRDGMAHITPYWDLHTATQTLRRELQDISPADAAAGVRALLHEATRYHLVADVPVGAFLSGGVDSAAVVGLMRQATGRPIETFVVGFSGAHAAFDERGAARQSADALGAAHHEVVLDSADAVALFEAVTQAIDQPSIDGTNTYAVSRAARQHVTVALSGLGGDELFAGYPHFRWFATEAQVPSLLRPAAYLAGGTLARLNPTRFRLCHAFQGANFAGRMALIRRLAHANVAHDIFQAPLAAAVGAPWNARFAAWERPDADHVQQTSYAEVQSYLVSTLLRDSDVMSMAHGLEVRPLLLHHPLVEFAYALPAAQKLRGRRGKRVFTAALAGILPAGIHTRRKMGFELPFVGWMGTTLRSRFTDLLATRNAAQLFTPAYLQRTRAQLQAGAPPRSLWAWGILLAWLEHRGHAL